MRLAWGRLLGTCWAAGALAIPAAPRVDRNSVAAVEKNIDRRLEQDVLESPFLLLGLTRGVYLEGYGVVLTSEVSLAAGPTVTPFRATISKEDVARLHQKKVERLPVLRRVMKEALVAAAGSLDQVPENEMMVYGVSLVHYSWEDTQGLPSQIVMSAPRRVLLEFQTKAREQALLDAVVKVREF